MNKEFEELRESWLDFEQFKLKHQIVTVEEYPNNVLEVVPEPEVSVHIITFQHAPYIRQAIDSVLMQKIDVPWEIIIGDDESTDGTREICIEYAKKYPNLIRLFLHKRENNIKLFDNPTHLFQYYYNSFNLRGKYIAICSGDDYWTDENKLQKQYGLISSNINFTMVYHHWKYCFGKISQDFEGSDNKIENKVFENPVTQTWMIKNVYNKIPLEALQVIQEDTFIESILRSIYLEGKFVLQTNISPSIYRIIDNSIFSTTIEKDKLLNRVNKDIKLYNVFKTQSIGKNFKSKIPRSLSSYFYNIGYSIPSNNKKKDNVLFIAFQYGVLLNTIRFIFYRKAGILGRY